MVRWYLERHVVWEEEGEVVVDGGLVEHEVGAGQVDERQRRQHQVRHAQQVLPVQPRVQQPLTQAQPALQERRVLTTPPPAACVSSSRVPVLVRPSVLPACRVVASEWWWCKSQPACGSLVAWLAGLPAGRSAASRWPSDAAACSTTATAPPNRSAATHERRAGPASSHQVPATYLDVGGHESEGHVLVHVRTAVARRCKQADRQAQQHQGREPPVSQPAGPALLLLPGLSVSRAVPASYR